MSNFLSKISVKTGSQSKLNRFDLSSNTYTTQDFFKLKPVYFKELMPGEKFKMNSIQTFTRLSPLVNPMYGSIRIVNRAFFVPYRLVMEGYNEFIAGTPYYFAGDQNSTLINKVSTFSESQVVAMFEQNAGPDDWQHMCTIVGSGVYDFELSSGSTSTKYRFTSYGKLIMDILNGLGYRINFRYNVDQTFSALPLLAYAKIFVDWYNNPAYPNYDSVSSLFKGYNVILDDHSLEELFFAVRRVMFDKDYFTSAWDNPTSPNNNLESPISIHDSSVVSTTANNAVSSAATSNGSNYSATPTLGPEDSSHPGALPYSPKAISQFMIDALKHVTDYVRRHQFVGSRVLDRYFGEYGIKLDSAKLNRSIVLSKSDTQINISDVTQTSTDYNSNDGVGNYAGKGIGYSTGGEFDFEADEFGLLVVTSYVAYKNSYVDGVDRYVHHLTKFDFFHGEFDSLGTQAIRVDELISGFNKHENRFTPSDVFGYVPRYAEYCVKNDNLLGDFRLPSRNGSLNGWNLLRRFHGDDDYQTYDSGFKHNLNFTLGDPSRNMDIFVDTNTYFDHFITIFRFDVTSYMPKRPLFDCLDFHSDGKDVNMSINGVTLSD